jgi:endonuclease/exonuclease/phosphatase (EEP) superfamily protein YafD
MIRLLAAAAVTEMSFAAAALGLLGLAGRRNGWLDVIAQFAPVWLAASLACALLAWPLAGPGVWGNATLIAALVGIAVNSAMVVPEFMSSARVAPASKAAAPLRLLTFNIWSENPDQAGTVDAILRTDADIIALQEIRPLKPEQRARLAEAYPHWVVSSGDGGDLAIAS